MRKIDDILDEIKHLKGLKKDTDLAHVLRVKQNTITTWRTRKTIPYDVLYRFCDEYEIDLKGLLNGEGSKEPGITYKPVAVSDEQTAHLKDFVSVPQMRGEISAGAGRVPDNNIEVSIAFRKDWIERKGNPQNMALIKVSGDSMSPTFVSGDLVLIDHNKNYIDPQGGLYAIVLNDGIMIKRIQIMYPGKTLLITSDNPNYKPIEVPPDQVQVNGKVIWFGREIDR